MTLKYHIGAFYYTLQNIPAKFRAKLDSIQIVAIADEEDIAEFGIEALLADFLETIAQLAAGIEIELMPNNQHVFHAMLVGLLGDIPAVHYIIGLKEGVGQALRFCRHCFGHGQEIQENFREDDFQPRTLPLHQAIVNALMAMPEGPAREWFSTIVGVNGDSVLDIAPHFNLIEMAPQDFMHTVLEGGLSHEMKLYIRYCLDNFAIDLEELNRRIDNFNYGFQERSNKPSPIKDAHIDAQGPKLPHQKASQLWLLARVLHFLLADIVPEDDPHRQCWELHLRILFAAAAPEVHPNTIDHLAAAIDEHHQAFTACYPGENITPKLHFYVHLPSIMLRLASYLFQFFFSNHKKKKKKIKSNSFKQNN